MKTVNLKWWIILSVINLFGFIKSNTLLAINLAKIEKKGQHVFKYDDLEYLEDENYTIEDVSNGIAARKFKVNQVFAPHNQDTEKYYWVKIKIKGNSSSKKRWLLEFFDQTTDYIEAYIPDENGHFIKKISGDEFPFHRRRFLHKNFEFEIQHGSSKPQNYYFKVKSRNHINIIIVVRSFDHFIYYALNEYFLYGMFYGMILIVVAYNFFMYLAVREIQYISYVLFVVNLGIYFMCIDGIAYQYLWPSNPEWNNIAYHFIVYSVVIWLLMFTKQFLHLNTKYPSFYKAVIYTIFIRTLVLIATIFYPTLGDYKIIDVLSLSVPFLSGIYVYKNGYEPARFFVIAYGVLFLGFILRILINLDIQIIPDGIIAHYSINLSFVLQMWLLSYALMDKVRIINRAKVLAQNEIIAQLEINQKLKDKVNKDLESEVSKRTREINEQKQVIEAQNEDLKLANERLRLQGEEINKINAMLDKDNFSLRNSIKEKILERAASKNMDYSEFKVIFPDEFSCLRYLEREKWKNGFSCKKCRNDKSIAGRTLFDKRCSKCGYNESPKAFTIFHGVKFSLEKAFYILHLIITERDDITLEELSTILDLRRNTCWSFKNKVTKLIEKHRHEKEYLEHWENIIFYSEGEQEFE